MGNSASSSSSPLYRETNHACEVSDLFSCWHQRILLRRRRSPANRCLSAKGREERRNWFVDSRPGRRGRQYRYQRPIPAKWPTSHVFGAHARSQRVAVAPQGRVPTPRWQQPRFKQVDPENPVFRDATFQEATFENPEGAVWASETTRERIDARLRTRRIRAILWEPVPEPKKNIFRRFYQWLMK